MQTLSISTSERFKEGGKSRKGFVVEHRKSRQTLLLWALSPFWCLCGSTWSLPPLQLKLSWLWPWWFWLQCFHLSICPPAAGGRLCWTNWNTTTILSRRLLPPWPRGDRLNVFRSLFSLPSSAMTSHWYVKALCTRLKVAEIKRLGSLLLHKFTLNTKDKIDACCIAGELLLLRCRKIVDH